MLSSRQIQRSQRLLLFAGLLVAAYYLLVQRTLSQQSAALDRPLAERWRKLAQTQVPTGAGGEINVGELRDKLAQARTSAASLEKTGKKIMADVTLDAAVLAHMRDPFQFIDFQSEQQRVIEDLSVTSLTNGITVAPTVFPNFPNYYANKPQPERLWGQLAFLEHLLKATVAARVTHIRSVETPAIVEYRGNTNDPPHLLEVPVRIEVAGSMASISRLLLSLPLRADDAAGLKLPPLPRNKPTLFIHRFLLRKNSPDNPEEVVLDLRACGFVPVN